MERFPKLLTLQQVIPYVNSDTKNKYGEKYCTFFNQNVKMTSVRLRTFARKGIACVRCGCRGVFFAMEKSKGQGRYHLNLYGYNREGNEILFTKDHILPKSKGGRDSLRNMQTMCQPCNCRKGNTVEKQGEIFAVKIVSNRKSKKQAKAERREWRRIRSKEIQHRVLQVYNQHRLDLEKDKTFALQALSEYFEKQDMVVVYNILKGKQFK